MPERKLLFLAAVIPITCLFCRAQVESKGSSLLAGNWHLTGGWTFPLDEPRLTVSFEVNGDNVRGAGDLQSFCKADRSGSGTSFFLAGKIAEDGSFVLTDPSFDPAKSKSPHPISISGTVPAPGSQRWSGTFYFPPLGRSKCTGQLLEGFTAAPLPPLKGTYSGKLTLAGYSTALVRLDVEQGGPASIQAKLTVSNWSKFPDEAATTYVSDPSSSHLYGDEVYLSFPAEDGSKIIVMGSFTDADELKLNVIVNNLRAGPAASALNYIGVRIPGGVVLTRQ